MRRWGGSVRRGEFCFLLILPLWFDAMVGVILCFEVIVGVD